MPYDRDLRDLIKATKKVAQPLPKTIEERAQKIHESRSPGSVPRDDLSIQSMAYQMMRLHGGGAIKRVLQCIEEAAATGNTTSVIMWGNVFQAIDDWEENPPKRAQH